MVAARFYRPEDEGEWNNFVRASKAPLFFFERSYLEYHADRFIDGSVVIRDGRNIIGLMPASRHGSQLISHGGLTFGGILVDARARSTVSAQVLEVILEFLSSVGIESIRYKAIPWFFRTGIGEEDLYYLLTRAKGTLIRRDMSSIIDLSERLKLSKGRKALLSKARQAGLSVEESQDWKGFHALLVDVLSKHEVRPVHTVEELHYLWQRHPDNIKLRVIRYDEEIMAATVLFDFGHIVHTQYLAASEKGKTVGALDFLIENCIAASSKARYFSFGISTESEGRVLNEGLLSQKESFGARSANIDTYEVKTCDLKS